jgi:hypothetical protein
MAAWFLFPRTLFSFHLFTAFDVSLSTLSELTMKSMLMLAALAFALTAGASLPSAQAAGCLKGVAAGGVAGHFAAHHGVLGAGAGCVIGHHEANKHGRQQQTQNAGSGSSSAPANNGGSSGSH